ncbi:hypothetical protein [Oligoflexus tunisiensis]|uniref:hypothetical protein n=1 Tax=Oligoflexus tunisiensis TaxID=708132 RepID=UPI00114D1ADC|nr:hypothetical protein [Oligoflexus tunisiensis]
MENYQRFILKLIRVVRVIFGVVLLTAIITKLTGTQETFLGGAFDAGMLDSAIKAFLIVEASFWALKYRLSKATK